MASMNRDGVALAFEDVGTGDPAFLFVHGWSCSRWFFSPQAEHFAPKHRCVSVDLRGHGDSDKPEQDYTIEGFADDVMWVAAELGVEKPILVGHSMGGAIALQAAASYPDALGAIVLVDPASVTVDRSRYQKTIDAFERGPMGDIRAKIADRFFLPGADPAVKADVAQRMLATPDHVALAAMRGLLGWDSVAAAAACAVPALHLAATPPINPLPDLETHIPGLVSGQTVGAGHFNNLEVPEQVNSMIGHFLREYLSAPT